MNNTTFKMRMSDGSEKSCVVIAEFTNEENNKNFVFYAFEDEMDKDETTVYTVIKTTDDTGYLYEQITNEEDMKFAKEMFDSINELAKEEVDKDGSSTEE